MDKRKVLMILDKYIKEDIIIGPRFHFEFYKDEFKESWINLLVKVDEFDNYESAETYFDETFLNRKETYKNMLFVLENDRVIGTCSLWEGYHFDEIRCRVHWMAVDPEYQGNKLGKALLIKIIELYKSHNIDTPLYLTTSDQNIIAIIMYKSVGFIPYLDTIPDYENNSIEVNVSNWNYINEKIEKMI